MENVYFDNAATTRLDDEVLDTMLPYMKEYYGNASSIYKLGRESRKAVETAREQVAKAINCNPNELYFTAGGSESDNTVIKGIAHACEERGKRAGTENVPGIVGMGKAIELAYKNLDEHNKKIKELRDYYIEQIKAKIPYININGDMEKRLPGNSNISFRFIEGEALLLNLDLKGIAASSGSACTSGSLNPSHVLLAIGLPNEVAQSSLRVSFGKYNTKEEVDYLIENLVEIVNRLREMSPLWKKFANNTSF